MDTAAELWGAFNSIFLDVAPFAALAALAVSWVLQKRRFDREARELQDRIKEYEEISRNAHT